MWLPVILWSGCGAPATDAPATDAPAPVPVETRIRVAEPLPPELDTDGPAFAGRLAGLQPGQPRSEACRHLPALCGGPGEALSAGAGTRVGATWGPGEDPPLSAVLLQLRDTGLIDALTDRWGAPAGADRAAPRWLGRGIRAVLDPGTGQIGLVTLRLEPYLTLDQLVADVPRFGFEPGAPLLGLPAEALPERYGAVLARQDEHRAWLRLWPVGDAFGDTLLVAELEQGRVARFVFDLNPGAVPTSDALVDALASRLGAPTASTGPEGERRLAFPGEPEIRLERGLSSMSVLVGDWGDRWELGP